jgi:hypothetical protein
MHHVVAAVLVALFGIVGSVTAAGPQLLTGKRMFLKDYIPNPIRKRAVILCRDPSITIGGGPGSADDPTLSGATVRIVSPSGGFDNTYVLPADHWRFFGDLSEGKGYLYRDLRHEAGPIAYGGLKTAKLLKILGSGAGMMHALPTDPNPVSVVLTVGTLQYCMTFGGTTQFIANKRFAAKDAPVAAACPP